MKAKKFDLVCVTWHDACSNNGWTHLDDINHPNYERGVTKFIVHTYGLLVVDSKKDVQVMQQYSPTAKKLSCEMTIPRGMVQKITVLKRNPWKI